MHAVQSKGTTLLRVDLENRVYQRGIPGNDTITFGVPSFPQKPGRIGRRSLESETLTCFDSAGGMDVVSEAGFSAYTLAFSAGRLSALAELLELRDVTWPLAMGNSQRFPSASRLHLLIRQLASVFRDVEEGVVSHQALEEELPCEILRTWFESRPASYVAPNNRSRAVKKALEMIRANQQSSLTVEQLCLEASCSISTLERAFCEHVGVSPKRFLTAWKLSGARKALLSSGECRSIAEIAADWGFWHLSKFSADYRDFFGELPSASRLSAIR